MTKQDSFRAILECLLNRGLSSDAATSWFKDVKHDRLVDILKNYLDDHRHFLGHCRIEGRQALNDRGVDVLLTAKDFKAGFQIKSHFDVTESTFAANVKRQFAEALSYGLDHYYILICSPLSVGKTDFGSKISHLTNELTLFQNVRFDVFPPSYTVSLFSSPARVSRNELHFRNALSDDCLEYYEKGYEHLPDPHDGEIEEAERQLDAIEDDWDGENLGRALADLQYLTLQKLAVTFKTTVLPTLPPDIVRQRETLIAEVDSLLANLRKNEHWDDRSEYKLPNWLYHVPEYMIPCTSLPNLLRIKKSLEEFLERLRSLPSLDGSGTTTNP